MAFPYVDDGDFTLYVGDVRAVLAGLPDQSVHCVVTSPPYWGLRDYGTGLWEGGDPECEHKQGRPGRKRGDPSDGLKESGMERNRDGVGALTNPLCSCGAIRTDCQLGLEPTPEEYVANMVAVFRDVRRVLRRDGTCFVNMGDSYISGQGGRQSEAGELPSTSRFDRPDPKERPDLPNPPSGWAERAVTRRTYPASDSGLKPKDLAGVPWRLAFALQQPYYTGKIVKETDRVWLAATIEAEGCMFIHKRKVGQSNGQGYERKTDTYGAGLEVASTDRVVVERCLEITGLGSICEQTPEQAHRRKQTLYRWNLRSNVCRKVICELYPHFIAKQHEARLVLGCPSSGEDARKAHESLKALHQGQAACIDFREPEGMWERGWYLRSEIIWSKEPNPMPESVSDRPTKAHETIFLLTKEPRYFFDQEAVREPAEWHRWGAQNGAGKYAGENSAAAMVQSRTKMELQKKADGSGRNIRSVWEIATEPFPESHFATFPQKLVERCVKAGTSERGCCPECGAPWERVVDTTYTPHGDPAKHNMEARVLRSDPGGTRIGRLEGATGLHRGPQGMKHGRANKEVQTLGWQPSCKCAGEGPTAGTRAQTSPAVVLDPFLGSGTTALVARRLGRRSVGIELSEEYAKLAARRLQQLSLFALQAEWLGATLADE